MFGCKVKTDLNMQLVADAGSRASNRSLETTAKAIQQTAKSSFDFSPDPSSPGTPPHTRAGEMPDSIQYAIEEGVAVIGTAASLIGESGEAHEFGGEYMGQDFEKRSFMVPALEANLDLFARSFEGSIS